MDDSHEWEYDVSICMYLMSHMNEHHDTDVHCSCLQGENDVLISKYSVGLLDTQVAGFAVFFD